MPSKKEGRKPIGSVKEAMKQGEYEALVDHGSFKKGDKVKMHPSTGDALVYHKILKKA